MWSKQLFKTVLKIRKIPARPADLPLFCMDLSYIRTCLHFTLVFVDYSIFEKWLLISKNSKHLSQKINPLCCFPDVNTPVH